MDETKKEKIIYMKVKEEISTIRNLISRDELPQAISLTNSLLDRTSHMNEIILQSAKYSDIAKQIRLGTVDTETANISKNKIRNSILELLNEIENYNNHENNLKINKKDYFIYLIIIAFAIVAAMVLSNRNTTIGIGGDNNDNNTIKIDK